MTLDRVNPHLESGRHLSLVRSILQLFEREFHVYRPEFQATLLFKLSADRGGNDDVEVVRRSVNVGDITVVASEDPIRGSDERAGELIRARWLSIERRVLEDLHRAGCVQLVPVRWELLV